MGQIDGAKLEAFVGRAVADMAATIAGVLVNLGHKLGLYKAMAGAGPLRPAELASRTGVRERYAREWLDAQAAGGYVSYDPASGTYELPAEQAFVLADPESPVFLAPAYDVVSSVWLDEDKIAKAWTSDEGLPWREHHPRLFHGTEAFFRTGYQANLTSSWIPALDGVDAKLKAGARVADVGCGHGASTIVMARAYPRSAFVGYDSHEGSIEVARQRAKEAGVDSRVRFEASSAERVPAGEGFDLVCFFDCLHDMSDPLSAARRAREILRPGGTVLLVEPFAGDRAEQNLNPVGRLFYAASCAVCVPHSMSAAPRAALGAQAGEARLAAVFKEAGFGRFRRATSTPFNLILEARA
jgi:2-polyprenyl-3-methyl-5-hydroxy-6-metoxy-1,4-benzoquinol methylase